MADTPTYEKHLTSAAELYAWAEDEGAVYDCALLSFDAATGSFVIGAHLLEDPPADPRDTFRRTHDRYLPFVFTAEANGAITVEGDIETPLAMNCNPFDEDDNFGLAFNLDDCTVVARATRWRVTLAPEVTLPVEHWADPETITFHGKGAITAAALQAALASRGSAAQLFGNWHGSGQSFGAAFVRDIATPPAVPPDEALAGAWRIAPSGADATDPRGVWLSGQSSAQSTYATLSREVDADVSLVTALVDALATSPGITWAVSGNTLVEDADLRTKWIALEP